MLQFFSDAQAVLEMNQKIACTSIAKLKNWVFLVEFGLHSFRTNQCRWAWFKWLMFIQKPTIGRKNVIKAKTWLPHYFNGWHKIGRILNSNRCIDATMFQYIRIVYEVNTRIGLLKWKKNELNEKLKNSDEIQFFSV